MKLQSKLSFWIGALIFVILIVSYFIPITIQSPTGTTITKLLGLIIFYNPIILTLYVIMAVFLIFKGTGRKIKFV